MTYEVPSEYLKRYGDLLVNYALGGGDGISPATSSAFADPRAPSRCTPRSAVPYGGPAATSCTISGLTPTDPPT